MKTLKGFKEFLEKNNYCNYATDEQKEFVEETAKSAVFELSQYIEFNDLRSHIGYENFLLQVIQLVQVLSLDLADVDLRFDVDLLRFRLDDFFKDYCKGYDIRRIK